MSSLSLHRVRPSYFTLALLLVQAVASPAQSSGSFRALTNDNGVIILDESGASPYPSTITVSGLTGVVTRVEVRLRGLDHSYPDDIDMLLVAPGGRKTLLLSDAGGTFPITDVNILFDDTAPPIPNSSEIVSGTYAPANWQAGSDDFPAPAPAGPYSSALGTFGDINPNGTWSLYIVDDIPENEGSLAEGWSLSISTAQTMPSLSITRVPAATRVSWPETAPGYILESRLSLGSPPGWAALTNEVVLTNGQYRTTVSTSDPRRFFRLRK